MYFELKKLDHHHHMFKANGVQYEMKVIPMSDVEYYVDLYSPTERYSLQFVKKPIAWHVYWPVIKQVLNTR